MDTAAIVAGLSARLASVLARPRGRYWPLIVDRSAVGWLDARRAERLAGFTEVFTVDERRIAFVAGLDDPCKRTVALDRVARTLASEGLLTAWRDERYAAVVKFGDHPRFELERAAARYFGIHTFAVHVNGLVRAEDGILMWIARRSLGKAIDPGMLDNLVGGGIASGATIRSTLVKEAWEEAGIPESMAGDAEAMESMHVCRSQPDGLQRETIFVHDLWLPAGFVPACQDGEVVDHRRVTLRDAARLAANPDGPDVVTADASLVIADCLIRHRVIEADSADYAALSELRYPALDFAAT